MRTLERALLASLSCLAWLSSAAAETRLNVLVVTTDDMSWDSVGVYGCKLNDTTPHMDRLASQSLRFVHAHVQVASCMPSRNVMFSGRYPHNNRVEGFDEVENPGYPVLVDLMQAGGWFTGIRGKVRHSTPHAPYPAWDRVLDELPDGAKAHPKDSQSYYFSTKAGIAAARQAGKPFFLNINISDPHEPFYGDGGRPDRNVPSHVFTADEVAVPGFLFDDPVVREELARYYSSVRRADDGLGAILRALEESGEYERTLIFFLSDHGMPLPFAKTQLYLHSTRTPLMVRWPGVTRPGAADDRHMVSAVDLLPTLLDIVRLPRPRGLDGRSFERLLRGKTQKGREFVVTAYHEDAEGQPRPMRAIVTKKLAYLFNPWSDGERVMTTATHGTLTYGRMQALAETDAEIAARLRLLDYRAPEELYDYAADPDALLNLIDSPGYRPQRERLTRTLEAWMKRTGDPLLDAFRKRDDPALLQAYMARLEREAAERRPLRSGRGQGLAERRRAEEP